jgi:hypothetical protein
MKDATANLEIEFSDGHKVQTDELLAWSRNGDWAVIHTDTGATPPLALADPKSVAVGDRLIVFNVEAGSRVIGGIDIGGRPTSTAST